jgi:protein-L-isoaspartate(D-aspartate) O-methyltransferase
MPEAPLERLQRQLIEKLSRTVSGDILAAFAAVPRHFFLPDVPLETAYEDRAVVLKQERGWPVSTASQPSMMAIMLRQLRLQRGHNVLEIGTASGYNAALMQRLVGNAGHVTTIELDADLARRAEHALQASGYGRVRVVLADGAQGYAPRASYDRIIATAGVWDVPPAWLRQLRPDGLLVLPVWVNGIQVSACFSRLEDGTWASEDNFPCSFVYLRGVEAPPNFTKKIGTSGLTLLGEGLDEVDAAALAMLLASDRETNYLDRFVDEVEVGRGLQLLPMLRTPPGMVFALYYLPHGATAYGLEHSGLALIGKASAAFVPYNGRGAVETYGAVESFLALHEIVDRWYAQGKPSARHFRLRLVPFADDGQPAPRPASLPADAARYDRRYHTLYAWLEQPT